MVRCKEKRGVFMILDIISIALFNYGEFLIGPLILLTITILSISPIFIVEKMVKAKKKKFKLTRIYSYHSLIPLILIYCSLIFKHDGAGWGIILWFIYAPLALLFYIVPILLDGFFYSSHKNKKQ